MDCPKCSGLMVYEEFHDYLETGYFNFTGWRCLICGKILDPLIDSHQKKRIPALVSKARRKLLKA
jgi:uncharacterized Zn finger protein